MKIKLGDHFTYKKILRFTLPSVVMMIFTSIYGVVDGLFVSNFVGKTAFSAVNFIMPVLMMLSTIGFMFGAGGSALISKTMGEGDHEKANRQFSLFVVVNFALSVLLAILGIIFIRDISALLGASGQMLDDTVLYGRIILIALPAYSMQNSFQAFFITAEKPNLGLFVTIGAGVTNIIFDAIFVAVLRLGLVGAAVATAISQCVGGFLPIIYFLLPNNSLLRLGKPIWDGRALVKATTNGASELLNNISMSLVGMLYNVQLLKYAGEDGVAAYGVIMYVSFMFVAVFIGYSIGSSPVISYHYGAKNRPELRNLLKKSIVIMGIASLLMFIIGEIVALPVSSIFVGYDDALLALTKRGFMIYSVAYLVMGYGIFSSGFFTALNDGLTSGIISVARTLVFQTISVLVLPMFMGVDGIWISVFIAEGLALIVSVILIAIKTHFFSDRSRKESTPKES